MSDPNVTGVTYEKVDAEYFDKRGLKRYAGVFSLWALGVVGSPGTELEFAL